MADLPPARLPLCPLCGKVQLKTYRPFCSKHCADLDLSRWFKGLYALPATDPDEDEARDHLLDSSSENSPPQKSFS